MRFKDFLVEDSTYEEDGIKYHTNPLRVEVKWADIDTSTGKFKQSYEHMNPNANFVCSFLSDLKTLEGAPKKLKGDFSCQNSNVTSLKYCPTECRSFNAGSVPIKSIEFAPQIVNRDAYLIGTRVRSLAGIGDKWFRVVKGQLGIPSGINENVLGLLTIQTLFERDFLIWRPEEDTNEWLAANIIKKYLAIPFEKRDLWDCQEELEKNKRTKPFAAL
jgi:hypothetical protein